MGKDDDAFGTRSGNTVRQDLRDKCLNLSHELGRVVSIWKLEVQHTHTIPFFLDLMNGLLRDAPPIEIAYSLLLSYVEPGARKRCGKERRCLTRST